MDKRIKVNIYYEEELDSCVVRILFDNLSFTNQFVENYNVENLDNWFNNIYKYMNKERNISHDSLNNMTCIITKDEVDTDTILFSELKDYIKNFIKLIYRNNKPFEERYKKLLADVDENDLHQLPNPHEGNVANNLDDLPHAKNGFIEKYCFNKIKTIDVPKTRKK